MNCADLKKTEKNLSPNIGMKSYMTKMYLFCINASTVEKTGGAVTAWKSDQELIDKAGRLAVTQPSFARFCWSARTKASCGKKMNILIHEQRGLKGKQTKA